MILVRVATRQSGRRMKTGAIAIRGLDAPVGEVRGLTIRRHIGSSIWSFAWRRVARKRMIPVRYRATIGRYPQSRANGATKASAASLADRGRPVRRRGFPDEGYTPPHEVDGSVVRVIPPMSRFTTEKRGDGAPARPGPTVAPSECR
jgi:hypothetical protein